MNDLKEAIMKMDDVMVEKLFIYLTNSIGEDKMSNIKSNNFTIAEKLFFWLALGIWIILDLFLGMLVCGAVAMGLCQLGLNSTLALCFGIVLGLAGSLWLGLGVFLIFNS